MKKHYKNAFCESVVFLSNVKNYYVQDISTEFHPHGQFIQYVHMDNAYTKYVQIIIRHSP